MGKYEMSTEEIQSKRAKLDESISQSLVQAAEHKAEDSPNLGSVTDNDRERWKDNLEAKGVVVLDR